MNSRGLTFHRLSIFALNSGEANLLSFPLIELMELFSKYAINDSECRYDTGCDRDVTSGNLVAGCHFFTVGFNVNHVPLLKKIIRGLHDLGFRQIESLKFSFPVVYPDDQHVIPSAIKCHISGHTKPFKQIDMLSGNTENARTGNLPQHGEVIIDEPDRIVRVP